MSREEALQLAPADPLGRRWARAVRHRRVYLAWTDGRREVIQLSGAGWKGQVRTTPLDLAWSPLPAWRDVGSVK